MPIPRLLLTDLSAPQRLRLTGAEWAVLFGFAVAVVPAVSTVLALFFWALGSSAAGNGGDLAALPRALAIGGAVALLHGLIPAAATFLVLRLAAAALGYINLPVTLLVAGIGALLTNFGVLGVLRPVAFAITAAALAVTAAIWTLLRAKGLGTRRSPAL